jgi:hypothetical protein
VSIKSFWLPLKYIWSLSTFLLPHCKGLVQPTTIFHLDCAIAFHLVSLESYMHTVCMLLSLLKFQRLTASVRIKSQLIPRLLRSYKIFTWWFSFLPQLLWTSCLAFCLFPLVLNVPMAGPFLFLVLVQSHSLTEAFPVHPSHPSKGGHHLYLFTFYHVVLFCFLNFIYHYLKWACWLTCVLIYFASSHWNVIAMVTDFVLPLYLHCQEQCLACRSPSTHSYWMHVCKNARKCSHCIV